jgi:hypothetical protein
MMDDEEREVTRQDYEPTVDEYKVLEHMAPDLPDPVGHFQLLNRLEEINLTLQRAFCPDGVLFDVMMEKPKLSELTRMNQLLERIAVALEKRG